MGRDIRHPLDGAQLIDRRFAVGRAVERVRVFAQKFVHALRPKIEIGVAPQKSQRRRERPLVNLGQPMCQHRGRKDRLDHARQEFGVTRLALFLLLSQQVRRADPGAARLLLISLSQSSRLKRARSRKLRPSWPARRIRASSRTSGV